MSNSKYDFEALVAKLNDADSVTMKFEELRELLGSWTDSAEKHQAWWSGKDRSHLQPLFAAGYKASPHLKEETVTFVKTQLGAYSQNSSSKPKNNGSAKSSNGNISNKNRYQRKPEDIEKFRGEIENFLKETNASEEIACLLKKDLSKTTDMPFYKQETEPEIITRIRTYCKLLINFNNDAFTEKLLSELSKQQQQSLRKLSRPLNKQSEGVIWEHSIPVNYTKKMLLDLIKKKDLKTIKEYLNFVYEKAPQIYLTKEQDEKVNQNYRDTMPEGWGWKTDDPFIRYKKAGIFDELDL